jgi:copper(I)-binding protein
MGKWLIGLVMGLVVLGGVYFLWKQQSGAGASAPGDITVSELPPPSAAAPEPEPALTEPSTEPSTAVGNGPAAPASSASAEGIIAVDEPWAKSTSANHAEAYMLFTNTGQIPDRIAAVSSPDADGAQIEETVSASNGARTRPANHTDLDPGVPLVFEPGSLHVALSGLKHPIKPGDSLTLVFTFAHAGTLKVKAQVGEQPALSDGIAP